MNEPRHDERKLTTADLARSQRDTEVDTRVTPFGPDVRGAGRMRDVADSGMQPRADQSSTPLFAPEEAAQFRSQWDRIQAAFVDQPRPSVEQADALVASVMKRLAEVFAGERGNLESQWHRGEDISTEDLRVALQRYRSFFARLLSV